MAAAGSDGVDIGMFAHARLQNLVDADRAAALSFYPLAFHQAKHPEKVKDGLVDAVGGQCAEPVEVRLVFKLEGPGEKAFKIRMIAVGQVEHVANRSCSVGRI